ncbi:MAG: alpha/beta fold hydrolase [Ardenticatenaceae bacterium]|nr:alpha/beta fold hydrolase [Ardenticatenaceae bacterium]
MTGKQTRFTAVRLVLLMVALALIAVAWWQVLAAASGLTVRRVDQDGVPLRFIVADGVQDAPGVVVAHGFSGSQQLMLTYGYTLAHAGYAVILLDFAGHGANAQPLTLNGSVLADNLATATAVLQAQPEVDPARLAVLGHSMGSGAVLQAAVDHGETYRATVAISPTGADVSPTLPRNLLLMAGSLEPPFVANAQNLLAQAGGPNPDFSQNIARSLVIVPYAEHISILFRWLSHLTALDWLNQAFGVQQASSYRDGRIIWYGLHLAGWLLLLLAVAPVLPSAQGRRGIGRKRPWPWLALVLGVVVGTAVLWLLNLVAPLAYLGGLAVGGALGVWFLVVGLVWLGMGIRPLPPTTRSLLWGAVFFAFLWLAFGLLSQWVWLPWFLIPARLLRWLPLALAFFPWLLAAGAATQGSSGWQRLGWWAWQCLVLVPGLLLLALFVPGLNFLALIVPVIPVIVGLLTLVGAAIDDAWAYGLGGALFFSWLVLAVFPLVG